MGRLHDEDDVGPFDEFHGERVLRIVVKTGRSDHDSRIAGKHLLRRGAAQAVLAAYEEDVSGGYGGAPSQAYVR
jgi:hypothetical protein